MLLYEVSGFDDYQSWCRAQCDLTDRMNARPEVNLMKKEDWKFLMDETRSQCAREPPQV